MWGLTGAGGLDTQVKGGEEKRWEDSVFYSCSDALQTSVLPRWSFGILLYEMITLGNRPFLLACLLTVLPDDWGHGDPGIPGTGGFSQFLLQFDRGKSPASGCSLKC